LKASVCGLQVVSVLPEKWFGGPTDPRERVEAMCLGVERLARFSPSVILALTGGDDGRDPDDAWNLVVAGFREVARVAAEHEIAISIEPVRDPAGSSLFSSLADAARLVREIACDNVGIMFDTWHHWDSPTVLADIASYGGMINSVHVADWRNPPRGNLDRALPGDGIVDLPALLSTLENTGYTGWYDLEVFADREYADHALKLEERDLLQRGWSGFAAAWAKAGLD